MIDESICISSYKEYGYDLSEDAEQKNNIDILLYPGDREAIILANIIIFNNKLWTEYPIINHGMLEKVTLNEVVGEGSLVEGQLNCSSINNPSFSFFDINYCMQ